MEFHRGCQSISRCIFPNPRIGNLFSCRQGLGQYRKRSRISAEGFDCRYEQACQATTLARCYQPTYLSERKRESPSPNRCFGFGERRLDSTDSRGNRCTELESSQSQYTPRVGHRFTDERQRDWANVSITPRLKPILPETSAIYRTCSLP